MTNAQIETLKAGFNGKTIYRQAQHMRLIKIISRLPIAELQDLAKAKIKYVSEYAEARLAS